LPAADFKSFNLEVLLLSILKEPTHFREEFETAEPFPHLVIDGLFPDSMLDEALAFFPAADQLDWVKFDNAQEKKLGYRHGTPLPLPLELILYRLNSWEMLQFLEKSTGIEGLIPDPYFGGGGLHQIQPGGFLGVHTDFNVHPTLKLDRRLNMLIYLNKEWPESYGGHLELWSRDGKRLEKRILPTFNRTVIFATSDFSYHGHPQPLSCPPDRSRRSLSLYYYSNGRPEEERSAPHDTLFIEPSPE
jgi:hypothetical protein